VVSEPLAVPLLPELLPLLSKEEPLAPPELLPLPPAPLLLPLPPAFPPPSSPPPASARMLLSPLSTPASPLVPESVVIPESDTPPSCEGVVKVQW
jgi:hypothetical protein